MSQKTTFNEFFKKVDGLTLEKTRKKMNKKSHKGRHYGHAPGEPGAGSGVAPSAPSVGEDWFEKGLYTTMIQEVLGSSGPFAGREYINSSQYHVGFERDDVEEAEVSDKVVAAQRIFKMLYNRKDLSRQDIIDAIKKNTAVTDSTAISYYQRFAKAAGVAGTERFGVDTEMGDMGGVQEPDDMGPDDQEGMEGEDDDMPAEDEEPVLRTVNGAHLISKEQGEDGRFEELWIYNVEKDMRKSLTIKKEILAGTDIGEDKTTSEDGDQSYSLWTVGNAQFLHIKGLSN